jgi:ribosomal protein S18 acetylase RimI-like enzyme
VAEATGVAIRPGGEDDVAAVTEIVDRAYEGYIEDLGTRPRPMDADHAAAARAGTLFVAEDGDGIVGLIVLVEEPGYLEIENVAVAPASQGRGTGRTLLGFAESEARRRGLSEVRLYTNVVMARNQRIYTRFGYVETGRRIENGFERLFYAKRLSA